MHDCRHDASALRHQRSIRLACVRDTQAAHALLHGTAAGGQHRAGLNVVLAAHGAAPNTLKSQVSHRAWARRPLPTTNLQYAALDVAFLVGPRPAPARPAPPARPPAALPGVSVAFL
jgi:ribonuclease D